MLKVLAINGSYRENGITDQIISLMGDTLCKGGAAVETISLRDHPIEFCINCRHCTQEAGDKPGTCIHHDAMPELINKIEAADAIILSSPTNFGTVTAIFKRFMERLVPYAYWPWGTPAPKYRKAGTTKKKAILVSSSAAPGLMGRLFFDTTKKLKYVAKVIGAESKGALVTGMIALQPDQQISPRIETKAKRLAMKLLE